jgi:ankyrin repeat protein
LCEVLVERGADPRISRNSDGATALHFAAKNGYTESCRYLVEVCSLDVNAMATSGLLERNHLSPLYQAAGDGLLGVCKYL